VPGSRAAPTPSALTVSTHKLSAVTFPDHRTTQLETMDVPFLQGRLPPTKTTIRHHAVQRLDLHGVTNLNFD
jgi:hypothetical protein